MSFSLKIADAALKQYKRIPEPFHSTIQAKIDLLAKEGLSMNNIKALTGNLKGCYRLRIGDYRILFTLQNEMIYIADITHRKDAYDS